MDGWRGIGPGETVGLSRGGQDAAANGGVGGGGKVRVFDSVAAEPLPPLEHEFRL